MFLHVHLQVSSLPISEQHESFSFELKKKKKNRREEVGSKKRMATMANLPSATNFTNVLHVVASNMALQVPHKVVHFSTLHARIVSCNQRNDKHL